MRKAKVSVHSTPAGILIETKPNQTYEFEYLEGYQAAPVSLTMPVEGKQFSYNHFPPFFEGLLPEGIMLDGLLRQLKIDANDYFAQLMATGRDLIGAVTVEQISDE